MEILFEQGPDGRAAVFSAPERVILAQDADQVADALADVAAAQAAGHWVAGYASYDMGYALEPRLAAVMPGRRRLPLLRFGVFGPPDGARAGAMLRDSGAAALGPMRPLWSEADYRAAFDRAHAYIVAGDIYQVNLTFPMEGPARGTPLSIYCALRAQQRVPYGALVQQDGLPALLSRSPELFFRIDAAGVLQTRPMKGTQPRGATPAQDEALRAFLAHDPKNRAENLMIVDLLRNDLSRVSEVGSVKVPELFSVESFATLHQMTSVVQGQLVPGTGIDDVLRALFPCGSITGAPKVRAMQVIRELEPFPREAYCGAIGWAAPDGRAEFNVAIRTLMLQDGRATLNVGGGVVYDSTAASEYEEALWKARFATGLPPA